MVDGEWESRKSNERGEPKEEEEATSWLAVSPATREGRRKKKVKQTV